MRKRLLSFILIVMMAFVLPSETIYANEEIYSSNDYIDKLPPRVSSRIVPHTESQTSADTVFSWYCRHTENGEIPVCPPEMNFLQSSGGLFLGNTNNKEIYLTFDAGYENGNVEKILNVLKEKDVKGSFFLLENIVRRNPDLVHRMADEGHLICNHTANHKDMSKITDTETFSAQLTILENILSDNGIKCSPYFRPPEGKFNKKTLEMANSLGYKTVMWSFAYPDWDNSKQPDTERAFQTVISGTHNGMIILLHPTSSTNAAILPRLIDTWREMGYSFKTLDEAEATPTVASADDQIIKHHDNSGMKVALTFDDGPHKTITPQVLQVLEKYGIHATFFVVGQNAETYPDIVKMCQAAGHEIANHTFTHCNISKETYGNVCEEIIKCENAVYENTESRTKLIRPPCGVITPSILNIAKDLDYSVVLWNVDTRDWAHTSAEDIYKNVTHNTKPGDIILMHDYIASDSHTVEALERFLPVMIDRGYNFVTVSELLGSK